MNYTRDELIAEVEFLIGTDRPESIATRLGYPRTDSLARRLTRNGRRDLARWFEVRHDGKESR